MTMRYLAAASVDDRLCGRPCWPSPRANFRWPSSTGIPSPPRTWTSNSSSSRSPTPRRAEARGRAASDDAEPAHRPGRLPNVAGRAVHGGRTRSRRPCRSQSAEALLDSVVDSVPSNDSGADDKRRQAVQNYVDELKRRYASPVDSTLLKSLDYASADPKSPAEAARQRSGARAHPARCHDGQGTLAADPFHRVPWPGRQGGCGAEARQDLRRVDDRSAPELSSEDPACRRPALPEAVQESFRARDHVRRDVEGPPRRQVRADAGPGRRVLPTAPGATSRRRRG